MTILGFTIGMEYIIAAGAGMAFLEAVARLTPNETDNKLVGMIGKVFASFNIRGK